MGENQNTGLQLSFGKAVGLLGIIVIILAVFIGAMMSINVMEFWLGTVFLWYFSSEKHSDMKVFPSVAIGSIVGYTIAAGVHILPTELGMGLGGGLAVLLIVVPLILFLMGKMTFFFNGGTFLYLTIGTIPSISSEGIYGEQILALIVGILFWGVLFGALNFFGKKAAAKKREQTKSLNSAI